MRQLVKGVAVDTHRRSNADPEIKSLSACEEAFAGHIAADLFGRP
jgi:hypothetical protein